MQQKSNRTNTVCQQQRSSLCYQYGDLVRSIFLSNKDVENTCMKVHQYNKHVAGAQRL